MTTDLDELLRTAGTELHLDRPVASVLDRGDRLRRRRHVVRLGALAVALVAAAGGVSLVLPPGSSPLPTAEAGWGRSMVNLAGDDLAEADVACRSILSDPGGGLPADARVVAADTRGGTSALLYRYADRFASCSILPGEGGTGVGGGGSSGGEWLPLPAGSYVQALGGAAMVDLSHGSSGSQDMDGPMRHAVGSARVADEVARLVVTVGDEEIEARVGSGLAVYWVPDGTMQSAYTAATFTAYADDGSELESGLLRTTMAR